MLYFSVDLVRWIPESQKSIKQVVLIKARKTCTLWIEYPGHISCLQLFLPVATSSQIGLKVALNTEQFVPYGIWALAKISLQLLAKTIIKFLLFGRMILCFLARKFWLIRELWSPSLRLLKEHQQKMASALNAELRGYLSFLPVCLSTVKKVSPSSTLYTTLALLPYAGSSASDAVTFITDVPVEDRQQNIKKENENVQAPGGSLGKRWNLKMWV